MFSLDDKAVKLARALYLAVLAVTQVSAADLGATAVFQQHHNGSQSDYAYAAEAQKLRAFVWRHWRQRARAQATVEYSTVEGDGGTKLYTIAPDERGVWRIVAQLDGTDTNFDDGTSTHRSYRWEAYEVARVKPRESSYDAIVPIRGDQPLDAAKYRLVLKGSEGNITEQL